MSSSKGKEKKLSKRDVERTYFVSSVNQEKESEFNTVRLKDIPNFRNASPKTKQKMRVHVALRSIISKRFNDPSLLYKHHLFRRYHFAPGSSSKIIGRRSVITAQYRVHLRKVGSDTISASMSDIPESDAKRISKSAEILCYFSHIDQETGKLYKSLTRHEYRTSFLFLVVQGIEDYKNHRHIIQNRRQSIRRRLF